MTTDECELAMAAMRSAWQYVPMADVQVRQFKRLFLGSQVEVVRDVIDDLIRIGAPRPGPAEMGELLRTKAGRPSTGGRAKRHGPLLDEVLKDDETPASEIHDRIAEIRQAVGL